MSSPYNISANYRRVIDRIANLPDVLRAISNTNLQLLVDKLNMERRVRGDELIPSVEEFRAKETQNNDAVFDFVKSQTQAAFDAGLIADYGDDKAIIKVIVDTAKAIIKFIRERS